MNSRQIPCFTVFTLLGLAVLACESGDPPANRGGTGGAGTGGQQATGGTATGGRQTGGTEPGGAAGSAGAAGEGGSAGAAGEGGSAGAATGACPESMPHGSCSTPSLECTYTFALSCPPGCSGGDFFRLVCRDGEWEVVMRSAGAPRCWCPPGTAGAGGGGGAPGTAGAGGIAGATP